MGRFNVKWALLGAVLALGGCGDDDDDIVPAPEMDAAVEMDAAPEMDAEVVSNGIAELLAAVDTTAATTTVKVFDPGMPVKDVYVTAVAGSIVFVQAAKAGPGLMVYGIDWALDGLGDLAVGDLISFEATEVTVYVPGDGAIPVPEVTGLANLTRSMQGADIEALRETLTNEDIVTNYGDYRHELVSIAVAIAGLSADQGGSAKNYDAITIGHAGPTGLVVRSADTLTAGSCYQADAIVSSRGADVQLSYELTATLLDNCPDGLTPPMVDPDLPPVNGLAMALAQADGELNPDVKVSAVVTDATASDFVIQEGPTGPAVVFRFANSSQATKDLVSSVAPALAAGDQIDLTLTSMGSFNMLRQGNELSAISRTATGVDYSAWLQNVTDVDVVTNYTTYESEYVTLRATVTVGAADSSGNGSRKDVLTTTGYTGPDLALRVPNADTRYSDGSCIDVTGFLSRRNAEVRVERGLDIQVVSDGMPCAPMAP